MRVEEVVENVDAKLDVKVVYDIDWIVFLHRH